MAHNFTLKRTWFTSKPRHTLSAVRAKATRPPNKCSPCRAGEQIKEGVGWVGRQEVACGVQLLPRKELPDQECEGEQASHNQAVSDAFHPSPACRNLRVLQRDT